MKVEKKIEEGKEKVDKTGQEEQVVSPIGPNGLWGSGLINVPALSSSHRRLAQMFRMLLLPMPLKPWYSFV